MLFVEAERVRKAMFRRSFALFISGIDEAECIGGNTSVIADTGFFNTAERDHRNDGQCEKQHRHNGSFPMRPHIAKR